MRHQQLNVLMEAMTAAEGQSSSYELHSFFFTECVVSGQQEWFLQTCLCRPAVGHTCLGSRCVVLRKRLSSRRHQKCAEVRACKDKLHQQLDQVSVAFSYTKHTRAGTNTHNMFRASPWTPASTCPNTPQTLSYGPVR